MVPVRSGVGPGTPARGAGTPRAPPRRPPHGRRPRPRTAPSARRPPRTAAALWRQLMSSSSFGAMSSRARGAMRATAAIGSSRRERVRSAAATIDRRREPSSGSGYPPGACGCRSGGAAPRRRRRPRPPRRAGRVRPGWRSTAPMLIPNRADRPEAPRAQEVDRRRDVAPLEHAERHEPGSLSPWPRKSNWRT